MAAEESNRPPLIRLSDDRSAQPNRVWTRQMPAYAVSLGVHGILLAAFLLLNLAVGKSHSQSIDTQSIDLQTKIEDDDPTAIPVNPDIGENPNFDAHLNIDRLADNTVPGKMSPNDPIGNDNGNTDPHNLPPPPGFGNDGFARASNPGGKEIGTIAEGNGMNGLPPLPATGFPGRAAGTREQSLKKFGGNFETEAAVSRGLLWLSKQQKADGSWDIDGNFHSRIAGTGIALLPFLAAGYTHKTVVKEENRRYAGRFPQQVEAGLKYLVSKQTRAGDFDGENMYEQAIAAMALCEAYGMTADKRLQAHAQAAIDFIQTAQNSGGGWRYSPGQVGDMSVTGWQIQALKSAFLAGLRVRKEVLARATRFLDTCAGGNPNGSTYGYLNSSATPTMTAVGLLCRLYLGWGPRNPALIAGVDVLKKTPPRENAADKRPMDIYYYYYATQVAFFYGGPEWHEFWNPRMRSWLLESQVLGDGPKAGSWSPDTTLTGSEGGRLLTTSLALLTLEVYYRNLPLYRRDNGTMNDLDGR